MHQSSWYRDEEEEDAVDEEDLDASLIVNVEGITHHRKTYPKPIVVSLNGKPVKPRYPIMEKIAESFGSESNGTFNSTIDIGNRRFVAKFQTLKNNDENHRELDVSEWMDWWQQFKLVHLMTTSRIVSLYLPPLPQGPLYSHGITATDPTAKGGRAGQ